jgi:two-component system chemotaxis response regulator CheB
MPNRNIIVIGASAGGLEPLCALAKNLPKTLDASIFVVMHVGSNSSLAEVLARCGNLPASPAEDRKPYGRGRIYVAPPNCHLAIEDGMTVLSRGPRENGHRPAIDVLFRSAARTHDSKTIGVILSGGRDDGVAGLHAIKKRGGIAIVQDPSDAMVESMPRSALDILDVDFCVPATELAEVLTGLVNGKNDHPTESVSQGTETNGQAETVDPTSEPPGVQVPIACPECNGPIYEAKDGELARFQCFVGHQFSAESLDAQHRDALERTLWTSLRTLKERTVLYKRLLERKRNRAEEALRQRWQESIATAETDIKLIREILDHI